MKKFLPLLVLGLLSFNTMAGDISFTTAEFRIVKVALTCPAPAPGRMACMATGGTVIVEATLGCLDELIFSHFELATENLVPTLRAVSVVRANSDSIRVMCTRINKIRKTVSLNQLMDTKLEINNEEIR